MVQRGTCQLQMLIVTQTALMVLLRKNSHDRRLHRMVYMRGSVDMKAPPGIHGGELRVYKAADGEVRVDVRLDGETVWFTEEYRSQLFGRERLCKICTSSKPRGTEPSSGT
jgi:hypothetical protein